MKAKLVITLIVFAISIFCGSVIVVNGILAGRYETLFPYTEKDVCTENEMLVLEKETTTGGTVVIDSNIYDTGFTTNTFYCVNKVGDKRNVTNETYDAVENLQKRIGWWCTIAFFLVTMILILMFERPILRKIDKVIGYKPLEEK